MSNNKTTILVADDHELVRKGIISLLIEEPNLQIIAEANNGKDLIYKYLKFKPDLIISDISMPELSGLEAITTLTENNRGLKVLFVSMYTGEDYIYHCIKAGGSGLINKDSPREELIYAIERITKGKKYFGDELKEDKISQFIREYEKNLIVEKKIINPDFTDQEIGVLLLIAEGHSSSIIADKLFISKRTVDTHRVNIIRKLGLHSASQLIKYAVEFSEDRKKKTI